jgi:ketosteroid isomerase-like protein
MKANHVACVAILALSGCATTLKTDDLLATMEADNTRWLAAFNTPNAAAFSAMHTKDAVLLPPGTKPVTGGSEAIRQFWDAAIKRGEKDHTFMIVSAYADDQYAYQVAQRTATLVKDSGEKTQLSGNTVRTLERQPDGRLLTKVHIYNRNNRN